jgi:hypothetical protein
MGLSFKKEFRGIKNAPNGFGVITKCTTNYIIEFFFEIFRIFRFFSEYFFKNKV